ncbi:Oidioi.mRNA.OKI2018_I69.XSR.g16739.t1.cds [Oikopleura dioica]|uniref:Oidioi.mRNA.OKI2018_I69.XSR.g16739.t1.cds n=1 Tax=Oikopleura dioica TaxID=34765 RepID=A0ABN7SH42_OIKDI|nr:Oidioi.mRNA.OKI2018_I69.XSR.g16739.t1.cds [Oikopleura dioica]
MVFSEEAEEFLMPRTPASTDPAFETFDGSDWNPDEFLASLQETAVNEILWSNRQARLKTPPLRRPKMSRTKKIISGAVLAGVFLSSSYFCYKILF